MTRKESYHYTNRIHKACKDPELVVVLKKMRGLEGLTLHKTVTLNPHKNILTTFVHEMFHVIYPTWTETKVYKMESALMHAISNRQMINLLGSLVQLLELNKDLYEQAKD